MRKLLFAILIGVMLAPAALADDHTFDEQKVIFGMERQMCTVLRNLSAALGVNQHRIQDCRVIGHSADLPHKWIYGWKPHHSSDRYKTWFEITAIYYVDGDSKVIKTQTSQPKVVEGEGWSNIYEAGDVPIDQEVNVTMELQEENSSSYDVGVSFSITNRTSAKVSGGVPGVGDAEVSTETEVTAGSTFGLNSSESSAKTENLQRNHDNPYTGQYEISCDGRQGSLH